MRALLVLLAFLAVAHTAAAEDPDYLWAFEQVCVMRCVVCVSHACTPCKNAVTSFVLICCRLAPLLLSGRRRGGPNLPSSRTGPGEIMV